VNRRDFLSNLAMAISGAFALFVGWRAVKESAQYGSSNNQIRRYPEFNQSKHVIHNGYHIWYDEPEPGRIYYSRVNNPEKFEYKASDWVVTHE